MDQPLAVPRAENSPIKFSVCIPTLNRADCIEDCLSSVFSQEYSDIEVLVLDGGSKDKTPEILEGYARSGKLTWLRSKGGGIDADILAAAEMASGDYIWFLSDDDALMPGALAEVARRLAQNGYPAGCSVNYTSYDRTLTYTVARVPATARACRREDHLYTAAEDCFSELGIHLGYLSAQIVRRSLWMEGVTSPQVRDCMGTCWMIAAGIAGVLKLDARWLYIHDSMIRNRTQNDSFQARMGVLRRHRVTHVDYLSVVQRFFDRRSEVPRAVRRQLICDRMPRTVAALKARGAEWSLKWDLLRLYISIYGLFPEFWFRVFPLFLVPDFAFRMIRTGYLRFAQARSGRRLEQKPV
jgi:glycosyltransferase involved in cell wall biosynthesis